MFKIYALNIYLADLTTQKINWMFELEDWSIWCYTYKRVLLLNVLDFSIVGNIDRIEFIRVVCAKMVKLKW